MNPPILGLGGAAGAPPAFVPRTDGEETKGVEVVGGTFIEKGLWKEAAGGGGGKEGDPAEEELELGGPPVPGWVFWVMVGHFVR